MQTSQHSKPLQIKPITQPLLRWLLLVVGWLSVILGVVGIFLPIMPTTPFLLLAAACFVRTSPKFYLWLVSHEKLGPYVLYYLDGKGIPKKAKVYTLITLWATILLTAFVIVDSSIVRIVLPSIAVLVSFYILRQPTLALER